MGSAGTAVIHRGQGMARYRDGREEDTRPREKGWMVEALPDRIPSTFRICKKCHLNRVLSVLDTPFRPASPHLGVKPKLSRKLEVDLGVGTLEKVCSGQVNNGTRKNPIPTIVMLSIASTFQTGNLGSKTTSSFWRTPRLKVTIAYSALKTLPLSN